MSLTGRLLLAALLAQTPAASRAEEPPTQKAEVEPSKSAAAQPVASQVIEWVRVEAVASREPLLDATSFSTVLLRQDLDRRMLDLDEALRESAGIQVRSFGGLGEFATVSIRGSSSEQVEVYLDGVPQRPALGGGVNLADFPSLALERVEVYRGFTPAVFGPASLAGAVSLQTRSPLAPTSDFRLSVGSFDSARLGALGAGRAGGWDLLGALEASRSRGDFGFYGTDHPQRRDNNDSRSMHLLGKARRPAGSGPGAPTLELYDALLLRAQGVPGFATQPTPDAEYDLFRNTMQGSMAIASPWRDWTLDPALYLTLERQRYRNPTRSPASDEEDRLLTAGLRAPLALRPGSRLRWTLTPELRHEQARRDDAELDPDRRFEARRAGAFLSGGAEWQSARGRLIVSPSLRWTALSSSFDGLDAGIAAHSDSSRRYASGKIGLRWALTEELALKANAGRFFREPSLGELYGNSGLIQGSPDLEAESGRHADLGLSWVWNAGAPSRQSPATVPTGAAEAYVPTAREVSSSDRRSHRGGWLREARLEGSTFLTRADDLILLFPTGGGTVRPQNSGRAEVTGVELSGALAAAGGLRFDLAFTRQRALDTSGLFDLEGKLLPGRPVTELHAGANLERGRWATLYRYSLIAENYIDRANTRRVPDRHLHTLGLSFSPRPAWHISLEAENLADQRVGDLVGYPLPGRLLTATVRFTP